VWVQKEDGEGGLQKKKARSSREKNCKKKKASCQRAIDHWEQGGKPPRDGRDPGADVKDNLRLQERGRGRETWGKNVEPIWGTDGYDT